MTPDVKLLPLPEKDNDVAVDGEGNEAFFGFFTDEQMEAYARANMEPLLSENERLRAEVARLRRSLNEAIIHGNQQSGRAERLAEAFREARNIAVAMKRSAVSEQVGGLTRGDPYAIARADAAIQRFDAALDQEQQGGTQE